MKAINEISGLIFTMQKKEQMKDALQRALKCLVKAGHNLLAAICDLVLMVRQVVHWANVGLCTITGSLVFIAPEVLGEAGRWEVGMLVSSGFL